MPWTKETLGDRPFVWQQDSAPCHNSKKSQKKLGKQFFDFVTPDVWPPNSPDLNPMDFFVWSAVKGEITGPPVAPRTSLLLAYMPVLPIYSGML